MAITNIHEHILQTHILTRLDGRTLAAAGCTSSHLQTLCSDDHLWSNICSSTWPSTNHPLITKTIANFPSGHRAFFFDAFPSPSHHLTTTTTTTFLPTSQLISSVDLWYRDQILFSKVELIDTDEGFHLSRFRVDVLEQKEVVQSELKVCGDDHAMQMDLEEHVRLSWIVIDPIRNRAVNVSSGKAVCGQRNWMTDEVELNFAVITTAVGGGEYVKCNVEVACGVNGGLGLYVSGMSLSLEGIDGKCLNGRDSLVILQGLMAAERGRGEGGRERYGEYIRRRKEWKEMMEKRERRLDLIRVVCVVGFLMAFWSIALY